MTHAEQIVEVVRDAAGQLTDGFHLLRLHEARFEALLLAQVVDDGEETEHFAVRADLRHEMVLPFAMTAVAHATLRDAHELAGHDAS